MSFNSSDRTARPQADPHAAPFAPVLESWKRDWRAPRPEKCDSRWRKYVQPPARDAGDLEELGLPHAVAFSFPTAPNQHAPKWDMLDHREMRPSARPHNETHNQEGRAPEILC